MKNKELSTKLDALVSKTPSKWIEESNKRFEDKEGLRYSQQVAVLILRALREQKLTQIDLAKLLNVSPQTVNKWLKGSENIGLFTIGRIDKVLGIKILHVSEKNNLVATSSTSIFKITSNNTHYQTKKTEGKFVAKKETKVIPLHAYINENNCEILKYN